MPTHGAVPRGLYEQVKIAERLMGKKVAFANPAEFEAYLDTMRAFKPQASFDPQGFLASLGLRDLKASGRTDAPVLKAIQAMPNYRPHSHGENGKDIWIQQRCFDLLRKAPRLFTAITKITTPIIQLPSRFKGLWHKTFTPAQVPVPTGVPAKERYKEALAVLPAIEAQFESDFHSGIPATNNPTHPGYGTYSIAKMMGFDAAAARRFGTGSNGVDENITPYGKTDPGFFGQGDRHFNLDLKGQDTRLVWAQRHLEAAIAYGKQGAFDQAEVELGVGLHSMQDLFAHGQLTESMHAVIGQYPDEVDLNPIGFYEGTQATIAYLRAYLRAISVGT